MFQSLVRVCSHGRYPHATAEPPRSLRMGLRAALTLLCVSALSASVAPTIAEANGIVASEVERAAAHGGWQSRTNIDGYSGSAFYYMDGATAFQSPGNDLLEYPFVISTGGTYQFQLRGRIAFGTDSTEHNDSFVRLVDAGGTAMAPVANNNTGAAVERPSTKASGKRMRAVGTALFSITSMSMRAAAAPIAGTGTCTAVNGGSTMPVSMTASKHTMLI